MKNKFILGGIAFILAVFFAGSVLAQEAENSQGGNNASKEERVNPEEGRLVATVNFFIEEIKDLGNNEFEIIFVANNSENVQPGIRYAISLQKEKDSRQEVFARKVYDEVFSLGPGEAVEKTVKYSAPKNLSGEFDLFLESASTDGLLLAIVNGGKVQLEGNRNLSSEKIESLNPNPNQSQYITNVRLDKDYYKKGDQAKIILDVMPIQIEGERISLSITGENQKSCLANEFWENDFSVNKNGANELAVEISEKCLNPVLTVSIKGKNGEMIDEGKYSIESKSEEAKKATDEKNRQEKKMATINKIVMIGIIIFVLAALIVSIKRKIKYRNYHIPIFFLIFSLGLIFFASPTSAHTNVTYDYSLGSYGVPINMVTYVKNAVTPTREGGTAIYRPADLNSDKTVTRKVNVSVTRQLVAAPGCTDMCTPAWQNIINTVAGVSILAKININNAGYSSLDTRFSGAARYNGYYVKSTATPINDYLVLPSATMGASVTIARQYQFNDYGNSSGINNGVSGADPAPFVLSAITGEDYLNGELRYYTYDIQDGYYIKDPAGVCNNFWDYVDYINTGAVGLCKYGVFYPDLGAGSGYQDISIENFSTSSSKGVWQCKSNVAGGTNVSCSQQPLTWSAPCGQLNNRPVCKMYVGQSIDLDYGGYDLCGYDFWIMYRLVLSHWGWPTRASLIPGTPEYNDLFPKNGFDFSPSFYSRTNTGPWSWKCNGFGGKVTQCQTTPGTMAVCGSAASVSTLTKPTMNLCSVGVISPYVDYAGNVSGGATVSRNNSNNTWQWYCSTTYPPAVYGLNSLGCDVKCETPQGGCVSDSANIIYYPSVPTGSQLCFPGGIASSVNGEGTLAFPWRWTCQDATGQIKNCEARKIDASLSINGSSNSTIYLPSGVNANFGWNSVNAGDNISANATYTSCKAYTSNPSSETKWRTCTSSYFSTCDSHTSSSNTYWTKSRGGTDSFAPINNLIYYYACRAKGTGVYSNNFYSDETGLTINVIESKPSCGLAASEQYCNTPASDLCVNNTNTPTVDSSDPSVFKWTCSNSGGSVDCSAKKHCAKDDVWKEVGL